MKNIKISVGLSEKISLEAHLGPKFKFCVVEPWLSYEAEIDDAKDMNEMTTFLRQMVDAEIKLWKLEVIQSRKGEL